MRTRDDYLGGMVGVVITIILFSIAAVVGSQIVGWLKTGLWPAFPVSRALGLNAANWPTTDWVGVQEIINFVLGTHVAFAIALAGGLVAWGLFSFFERITRPSPPRE